MHRIITSELFILAIVWAGFLVSAAFSYPPIGLDSDDLFYSFYYIAQAYLIAFPIAGIFLKKRNYAAFIATAASIIAAAAVFNEYLIEKVVFKDDVAVWFGAVDSASEAASVVLFVLVLKYIWRHHADQRRIEQLARAKVEHELAYLKAQIHPHILFNELNNIYSHAIRQSEDTPKLILMLSDILRYTIYDSAGDQVALDAEIEYLRKYVELQRIALGERGDVDFNVVNETTDKSLPPFLLMPFVENCFKHSASSLDRDIKIEINITARNSALTFTCENNFDGGAKAANIGGVGLTNVRRRLELLFHDRYALTIEEHNPRYRVDLRIPIT